MHRLSLLLLHKPRLADPPATPNLTPRPALAHDMRLGSLPSHVDDIILSYIALYDANGRSDRLTEYQTLPRRPLRHPRTLLSLQVTASRPNDLQ
jgi:hypothetical protein